MLADIVKAIMSPQVIEVLHMIVAIGVVIEFVDKVPGWIARTISRISSKRLATNSATGRSRNTNPPRTIARRLLPGWMATAFDAAMFWLLVVGIFCSGALATYNGPMGLLAFAVYATALAVVILDK